MIEKELFVKIINKYIEYDEYVDALENAKIHIVESLGFETCGFLLDEIIRAYFNKEGQDWITWYLFEKRNAPEILHAYDEDNNEICRNVEELWDIVKEFRI